MRAALPNRTASVFPSSPADSHACPGLCRKTKTKPPGITYNAHYKDWSFKKLPSKNWQSIVHKTVPKPPASVEWIFRTFRQSSRRRPPLTIPVRCGLSGASMPRNCFSYHGMSGKSHSSAQGGLGTVLCTMPDDTVTAGFFRAAFKAALIP